jgi:hypothetical protein
MVVGVADTDGVIDTDAETEGEGAALTDAVLEPSTKTGVLRETAKVTALVECDSPSSNTLRDAEL